MSTAAEAFNSTQEFTPDTKLWPELKPLMRPLPPAPPFPVEALGTVNANAARKMHEIIQAPLALCGQSVLAAITLTVQPHANVSIDGRSYPLSEYFVEISESGERKTATDDAALLPLAERQDELRKIAEPELAKYEVDKESYDAARREVLGKGKGIEGKREAITKLGKPPEPPLVPVVTVSEPTYEGAVKLLAIGQPSLGLFTNEGGQFMYGHAMSEENKIKTAAGLSKLWDGKPVDRCRAGDGTGVLYGRRLSMHLMLQPAVSHKLVADSLLSGQGLLSRMLVNQPDSTMGTRMYARQDLYITGEMQAYYARMRNILRVSLPLAEGKRNELKPRNLPLAPVSYELWIKYHDTVERELGTDGKLASIRGLAAKAAEHALRLAAILAMSDNLECHHIDLEPMKGGISLATFYVKEALRLFNAGATDADLMLASKLLAWIKKENKQVISLVEIYQYGPVAIRDSKTASKLMQLLEEHGRVRPSSHAVEFQGIKRRNAWEIRADD